MKPPLVQVFPGMGGTDYRTIGEFLNTNHDFISRLPKHASGALMQLLTENMLYSNQAGKCREMARALRLGDREGLLKVLTSYTLENETPKQSWAEYEAALNELMPEELDTLANRVERHAQILEGREIPEAIMKLRVFFTGADGKFIQDLIQVATQAPPGGVAPAELAAGRNGSSPGNVVVVSTGSEQKQRNGDGWKGLGD